MNREFLTYTDEQGRKYIEEPMPEEFIGTHISKYDGTPVRMNIIDPNEKRKFIVDPKKKILRMSDDGIEGLVAYFDYYVTEENGLIIGYVYVHPFHRKTNIYKNTVTFMEQMMPENAILDAYEVHNPVVQNVLETRQVNEKNIKLRSLEIQK